MFELVGFVVAFESDGAGGDGFAVGSGDGGGEGGGLSGSDGGG